MAKLNKRPLKLLFDKESSGTTLEGESVDGYSIIGVVLFFTTLIVLSYILLRSHGIKIDLEDKELKRATRIIRFRNIALILGMFAISFFFILLSSMPPLHPGTGEYAARDNVTTYMLYAGIVLLATAVYLEIIGRKDKFNFKRSLQQYAVKEKIRAMLKFKRKSKHSTRA